MTFAWLLGKFAGSVINVNNDNSVEVKKRILLANKGFYGLKRQFRSQFVSKKQSKTVKKPA